MIPPTFLGYSSLLVIVNGPGKGARYMPDFLPGQVIRQRLDFQNLSKSQAQQQPTPCGAGKLHSAGGSNNFWRLAAGGVLLPQAANSIGLSCVCQHALVAPYLLKMWPIW